MRAESAAAPACLVYDGQARGTMLVKLSAGFFHWIVRATTRIRRAHDLLDAHLRSAPVVSGDDAYQLEMFSILNHKGAAVA